jgi:hypothetical protein
MILASLCILGAERRAAGCDICAIYTATEQRETRPGFTVGIAEQYSHFGTERLDGEEVHLPADEHMDSSITQFLIGYAVTPRIALQLDVPFIDRQFTRIRDHRLDHGSETGAGDMALVANVVAFRTLVGNAVFHFSLLGGLKLPTGNADRLAEELPSTSGAAAARHGRGALAAAAPALPEEGGLHGHDLALGSGSVDGIVGGQIFWSWGRLFTTAAIQYAVRTTGSFDYHFANDLTWLGGPGWFVLLGHDYSLGLQALLAGETKGNDSQAGVQAHDTAITALYAGPAISVTWRASLGAELAVDLPAIQHNTGLQLLPDARVRGGFTWHF